MPSRFEHEDAAFAEAERHPLTPRLRTWLASRARSNLDSASVRQHSISFDRAKWKGLIPAQIGSSVISRGDVFAVAQSGNAVDTFKAMFIWGTGKTGYGPHRCRTIVEEARDLDRRLQKAQDTARVSAIDGYAQLYGGYSPTARASASNPDWSRVRGLGPAFFTKFLYFTTPGALILDNVLATRVAQLSGMSYLVTSTGRSYNWTPYRYAIYLHWMKQTSNAVGCTPDELELTLFSLPSREISQLNTSP